jgi:hypothetical protein
MQIIYVKKIKKMQQTAKEHQKVKNKGKTKSIFPPFFLQSSSLIKCLKTRR